MGGFRVYHSKRFDSELSNFDKEFQDRVDKIEDNLMVNPYAGDPIGTKWFREKRINGKRVYFLIYENLDSVLMVAISDKKDQQKVINTIKLLLDFFREEIVNLVNKEDLT